MINSISKEIKSQIEAVYQAESAMPAGSSPETNQVGTEVRESFLFFGSSHIALTIITNCLNLESFSFNIVILDVLLYAFMLVDRLIDEQMARKQPLCTQTQI